MKNSDLSPLVLLIVTSIGILAVLWLIVDVAHTESSVFNSVKTGEKILTCELHTGTTVINPEMVHRYNSGVWYFYNGSASSCFLSNK